MGTVRYIGVHSCLPAPVHDVTSVVFRKVSQSNSFSSFGTRGGAHAGVPFRINFSHYGRRACLRRPPSFSSRPHFHLRTNTDIFKTFRAGHGSEYCEPPMSNTMTTMNEPVKDTLKGSPPELSVDEHNVDQPTAFISKLFQMIGGAPNEVIAVSNTYHANRILRLYLPSFRTYS